MSNLIPPAASIRDRLAAMTYAQVQSLSRMSRVPFTTLWKIRDGTTTNPGIETVRLFIDHIGACGSSAHPEPTELIGVEGAPQVPADKAVA